MTYLYDRLSSQFQHVKERNHKTFCSINTFKQGRRVYTIWVPRYPDSLERGTDLWKRVDIFVRPTYILNSTYFLLQATVLQWNTSTRKGTLSSRVITAFARAVLKQLFLFWDWEECHLVLYRYQMFARYISIAHSVPCFSTPIVFLF
jgi:hypothetical protein